MYPIFLERFLQQIFGFALASNHTWDTTFHSLPRTAPGQTISRIAGLKTLNHTFLSSSILSGRKIAWINVFTLYSREYTKWIQSEYKTETLQKRAPNAIWRVNFRAVTNSRPTWTIRIRKLYVKLFFGSIWWIFSKIHKKHCCPLSAKSRLWHCVLFTPTHSARSIHQWNYRL